jgi:hypothetical protein
MSECRIEETREVLKTQPVNILVPTMELKVAFLENDVRIDKRFNEAEFKVEKRFNELERKIDNINTNLKYMIAAGTIMWFTLGYGLWWLSEHVALK